MLLSVSSIMLVLFVYQVVYSFSQVFAFLCLLATVSANETKGARLLGYARMDADYQRKKERAELRTAKNLGVENLSRRRII